MKTKLVIQGTKNDKPVMVALALRPEDNLVDLFVFPEPSEELIHDMEKDWRAGKDIAFPEGHEHSQRELSATETLLPDDILTEQGDLLQRAQSEWHFVVLSHKLNETYRGEMEDLKSRVERLENYDSGTWEELKGFWDKVQNQVRDKNLYRKHADQLRDETNGLFNRMKALRSDMNAKFMAASKETYDKANQQLEELEARIAEGTRLPLVFEELKKLQGKLRNAKLANELRDKMRERIDAAFKAVKDKQFGNNGKTQGDNNSQSGRIQGRMEGLLKALEKMERSVERDEKDLHFENKRLSRTDGQLEAQIREAKIQMISTRLASKREKLAEMQQTKTELEEKLAKLKAKDEERKKRDEAKRRAEEKIHEKVEAQNEELKDKAEDLQKAADAINEAKQPKESRLSTFDKIMESAGEMVKDLSDTVRAVAEVAEEKLDNLEDRIEDKIDALEDKAKTLKNEIEEKAEAIEDKVEAQVETLVGNDDDDDDKAEGDDKGPRQAD